MWLIDCIAVYNLEIIFMLSFSLSYFFFIQNCVAHVVCNSVRVYLTYSLKTLVLVWTVPDLIYLVKHHKQMKKLVLYSGIL